jgi:hypothetical protein
MTSFRVQASLAKMTSPGGKLIALGCHPTKNVNKAEEVTYLSTNIDLSLERNFEQKKYGPIIFVVFMNEIVYSWTT